MMPIKSSEWSEVSLSSLESCPQSPGHSLSLTQNRRKNFPVAGIDMDNGACAKLCGPNQWLANLPCDMQSMRQAVASL